MRVKRDQWLDVIRDVIRECNLEPPSDQTAIAIAESMAAELNYQSQQGLVTPALAAEILAFYMDLVGGQYDQAIDAIFQGTPPQ